MLTVFFLHSRCKSQGVNTTGTQTMDNICNEESRSNTRVTTAPTSNKVVSRITRVTSHHPHEGAQTQKMLTGGTTSAPGHIITPKTKVQPFYPSNTGNHIGKTFAAVAQPHITKRILNNL